MKKQIFISGPIKSGQHGIRRTTRIIIAAFCCSAVLPFSLFGETNIKAAVRSERLAIQRESAEESGIKYWQAQAEKAQQDGDAKKVASAYVYMGEIYAAAGHLSEGIDCYQHASTLFKELLKDNDDLHLQSYDVHALTECAKLLFRAGRAFDSAQTLEEAKKRLSLHLGSHGVLIDGAAAVPAGIPDELLTEFVFLRCADLLHESFTSDKRDIVDQFTRLAAALREMHIKATREENNSTKERQTARLLSTVLQYTAEKLQTMRRDNEASKYLREALSLTRNQEGREYWRVKSRLIELLPDSEMPLQEKLDEYDTIIGRSGARDSYTRCYATLAKARILKAAGRGDEAIELLNTFLESREAAMQPSFYYEALEDRTDMMLRRGQYERLSHDLQALLRYCRLMGFKTSEPKLYHQLAVVLHAEKRYAEAIYLAEQGARMAESFGMAEASIRCLLRLNMIASELGDKAGWQSACNRIAQILATKPNLPDALRKAAENVRDTWLAMKSDQPENKASENIEESYAARPSVADNHEDRADPVVRATTEVDVTNPSPLVDLQPVACTSLVVAGEFARGRFTLSNPTAANQVGSITVRGAYGIKSWETEKDGLKHSVLLDDTNTVEQATRDISLAPGQESVFVLEKLVTRATNNSPVEIIWNGQPVYTSQWVFAAADTWKSTSIVNANFVLDNEFYAVPLLHELYCRADQDSSVDIRIQPSLPCRIEIWNEDTGTLIAADGDGTGTFLSRCDIVASDSNSNGYPDLVMGPAREGARLRLYVFPLSGHWPDDVSNVTLYIYLSTPGNSEWQLHATDEINLK